MEPPGARRRLKNVRRVTVPLALIAVGLFSSLAGSAAASELDPNDATVSAQGAGPVRVTASAGLAGFVDARRPVELAVTIAADVLFAGTLEVRQGDAVIHQIVEVPAATEKIYAVRVPPPIGSVTTRIRLFEDDVEAPVVTTNLNLKAPQSETVVAVVGSPELVATIGDSTIGITGSDVVAAAIDASLLETGPAPARYLVLQDPVDLPDPTREWVAAGGRVIVEPAALGTLGLDLGSVAHTGDYGVYQVGRGRVIGVPDLDALDSDDWSGVMSPTPVVLAPRDVWQSPDLQLMMAATSGGDQRIPGLPWLFGAVVGYAVLVGPVNFLILRRLGRRELAWITVPLLSVVAVAGFWMAGRQRLQTTLVNHATFIVADPNNPTARTAVAVAAGTGGDKVVTVPEDWLAYPGSASPEFGGGMPVAPAVARTDGESTFHFTLEQLGAAGVQGWWRPAGIDLPAVTATADGNQLEISVDNSSRFEFWAWGIVARGRATVAPDVLSAGGTGSARVLPGQAGMNEFGSVGDAVINARQLWNDPFIWNRLGPLSYGASMTLEDHSTYFFGFTTQLSIPISVDGRQVSAGGESLVVVPVDLQSVGLSDASSDTAHLVDVGDASWIDWGPGYLSISSQEITVGWNLSEVPGVDPFLNVNNIFGEIPRRLDAYNWTTSSYDRVEAGDQLDLALYRNPLGDILLRARATEDESDFAEFPMTPYAFTLEWDQ
ncbi:MAG TPA: hypothetical protein VIA81_11370 [Acidimicrobiia bacterium]